MGTSIEDILHEEMWTALHDEAVMKNAATSQCIYVFVEGESEEFAIPIVLEKMGIDVEKLGIVIANYNGIGNLKHSLRLLYKTLSHDRPVLITFDNDMDGSRINTLNYESNPLLTFFPIPSKPMVAYSNGISGGSFEEAFNPDLYITACLRTFFKNKLTKKEKKFRKSFDIELPWFSQLACFLKEHKKNVSSINKPRIAKWLAQNCDPIPDTFVELGDLIINIREQHPIKHPDDIELEI